MKKIKFCILSFFVLINFNNVICSDHMTVLDKEFSSLTINRDNIFVFEDRSKGAELKDVYISNRFLSFDEALSTGEESSNYWLKGYIYNDSDENTIYFNGWQLLDTFEFYYANCEKGKPVKLEDFKLVELNMSSMNLKVRISEGKSIQFFLKLKGKEILKKSNVILKNFEEQLKEVNSKTIKLQINKYRALQYLSIPLLLLFVFRSKLYIYACLNAAIVLMSAFEYDKTTLFPLSYVYIPFIIFFLNLLNLIVLCRFFQLFFDTKNRTKKLHYLLGATSMYYVILYMLYLLGFIGRYGLLVTNKFTGVYLQAIVLLICSIYLWLKDNDKIAMLFAFNFFISCSYITSYILLFFFNIHIKFFEIDNIRVALVFFQMLALSAALIKKAGLLNLELKTKINVSTEKILSGASDDKFVAALAYSTKIEESINKILQDLKSRLPFENACVLHEEYGKLNLILDYKEKEIENFDKELFIEQLKRMIDSLPEAKEGAIVFNNMHADNIARFYFENSKAINSIVLLPMITNNRYIGSLVFFDEASNAYSQEFVDFVRNISINCAIVIQHFKQLEEINERETAREIETRVRRYQEDSTHNLVTSVYWMGRLAREFKENYFKLYKNNTDPLLEEKATLIDELSDEALVSLEENLIASGIEAKTEFEVQTIYDSIGTLESIINKDNIELVTDFKIPANTLLYAPKRCLVNIIRGMLKNSMEAFSGISKENKQIRISIKEKDGKLSFAIYDNGSGIKKEHMKKIFGLFTYNKPFGTGRGLMFAKSIIESLDGNIEFDSVEGEYTEFKFTINVIKNNININK